MELGANVDTDLANEYCTKLNDDFLNLFDGPSQPKHNIVVREHHEPWKKAFGINIQVCTH